ncbi:hypothetical protein D3C87_1415520 [compost metagenome]
MKAFHAVTTRRSLVPDQSIECRRNADRTGSVGSDGAGDDTSLNSDGRARGRPARNAALADRDIAGRCSEMRIQAKPGVSKFREVGFTQRDHTECGEGCDHLRILDRHRSVDPGDGAGSCSTTDDIQQILDRIGNPVKRAQGSPLTPTPGRRFRIIESALFKHINEHVRRVFDRRQGRLDQLIGCRQALSQSFSGLHHRDHGFSHFDGGTWQSGRQKLTLAIFNQLPDQHRNCIERIGDGGFVAGVAKFLIVDGDDVGFVHAQVVSTGLDVSVEVVHRFAHTSRAKSEFTPGR